MNEIKVGQLARYKDPCKGVVKIGTIESIEENHPLGNDVTIIGLDYYIHRYSIIKSADNLVDLLEVGDIVHLAYQDESIKPYEVVLQDKSDLQRISRGYKVIAIELAENRVKQVIE